MRYVLMQGSLERPDPEQLRRAFGSVRSLTRADAVPLATDAYGILVSHLNAEDAQAVCAALAAEGVETEVVAARDLPALPPTRFVRRAEPESEGLRLYDPLGRGFVVPWEHVWMLAGGGVTGYEVSGLRSAPELGGLLGELEGGGAVPADDALRAMNVQLVLDILVGGGALRYTIRAEHFLFGPAVAPGAGLLGRFNDWVRRMSEKSPMAAKNRGVSAWCTEPPGFVVYPSRNAFQEEMIWMMWQAKKQR